MLAIEQIMLFLLEGAFFSIFLLEGAFFELYKFELFQNTNCKISKFLWQFSLKNCIYSVCDANGGVRPKKIRKKFNKM